MTLEMYVEDRMFEVKQAAFEDGIQEGLERGSFKKAYETAQNLLNMGLSIEQISFATGLSIEQLREIADEINAEG